MPKNGQNDLKFGHNMYCDHFYPFFKFCQNLSKNCDFLAKNRHFLDFTSRFPLFNFQRKTYQVLGKWTKWANFLYKCSLGYLLQKWDVTFGYVVFLKFYRARYVQRELFFANFGKFWPKKALFAHIGPYKMSKTPHIQKLHPTFVVSTPKNIYTKN